MTTRTLGSPPSILPLYARAAAPMIPGASLLPFVPGRADEIPDLELELPGVKADPERVASYSKVCGFTLRGQLPPTYPHVLAFPLHMAVMADGSFPFGAVGLVHVENRIDQHRPIGLDEALDLRVRPTGLEPHPSGRTFGLVTEARRGEELIWRSVSTMLRRGGGSGARSSREQLHGLLDQEDGQRRRAGSEWRLGGDLGRRYAAVSGDRNPIHMHWLTAKPLGFKSAIAHGMWTNARCLAAIERRLPDAFGVEVRFRKPIFLPARVEFLCDPRDGEIDFAVRDSKRRTPHLEGLTKALGDNPSSGRKKNQ
jgi:acyl dehydratase